MDFLEGINWLDAAFAVVLILFILRGALRGIVKEITFFVGLGIGAFFASLFSSQASEYFTPWIADPQLRIYAAYAAVFICVKLAVTLIMMVIRRCAKSVLPSWLDHLAGAFIGFVNGLLLCFLALTIHHLVAPESHFLKESVLAEHIENISTVAIRFLPPFPPFIR